MPDMTEQQRLAKGLSELILDLIENGREVVAKDGSLVRVKASPSDIREARAWLKEIEAGNHGSVTGNGTLTALQQRAMLRFQGRDVPGDEDLAETGT